MRTIVGSCIKCASSAYPDITDTNSDMLEANPKLWYQAFGELISSNVWILINPPAPNEQPLVRSLIEDAAKMANIETIYIISHKTEDSNWCRNKLEVLLPEAEIKSDYHTLNSFLDEFKNLSMLKEPDIQPIETVTTTDNFLEVSMYLIIAIYINTIVLKTVLNFYRCT